MPANPPENTEIVSGLKARQQGAVRRLRLAWRGAGVGLNKCQSTLAAWAAKGKAATWPGLSSCRQRTTAMVVRCRESERLQRALTATKSIESRYPWRSWLRAAGARVQQWCLVSGRFCQTRSSQVASAVAASRAYAAVREKSRQVAARTAQTQAFVRAEQAWCRVWGKCRLCFPYLSELSSAWPRTAQLKSTEPKELAETTAGIVIDSESPLGIAHLVWSTRTRDAYLAAGGEDRWSNTLWADADCPLGYARIIEEYLPPAEPEIAQFEPEDFLTGLFEAYSELLEQRGDANLRLAPVVPLVDVYALYSSVLSLNADYSKEQFIQDVFRLHSSGVNTTRDGAKVSFPISRGVKGKTLTVSDETGHEHKYYGVRFLNQSVSS